MLVTCVVILFIGCVCGVYGMRLKDRALFETQRQLARERVSWGSEEDFLKRAIIDARKERDCAIRDRAAAEANVRNLRTLLGAGGYRS